MNDEVKGKMISEFVELKSKMQSLVIANSKEIKKTKDIDKNIVKNTHIKKYVDVLFNKISIKHKMKRIQRTLHDKRYILDDKQLGLFS